MPSSSELSRVHCDMNAVPIHGVHRFLYIETIVNMANIDTAHSLNLILTTASSRLWRKSSPRFFKGEVSRGHLALRAQPPASSAQPWGPPRAKQVSWCFVAEKTAEFVFSLLFRLSRSIDRLPCFISSPLGATESSTVTHTRFKFVRILLYAANPWILTKITMGSYEV